MRFACDLPDNNNLSVITYMGATANSFSVSLASTAYHEALTMLTIV